MNGPKRLIEDGTTFDRALLRAGREDRPSSDYERRVLAAASALPATASAAAGRPSLVSRLVRPQYLAVVVAIGVGTAFVSSTSSRQSSQPASPVATVTANPNANANANANAERAIGPASSPTSPRTTNEGTNETAPTAAPVVTTPEALPSAPASASAPRASAPAAALPSAPVEASARGVVTAAAGASLQREVELLDSVKRSLRSGAHDDAQRALDSYDAEFPSGTLKPEAGFMRIRLLLARGDRAKARALGDELRARYPNSVHARRIQAALAADAANESQDPSSPR